MKNSDKKLLDAALSTVRVPTHITGPGIARRYGVTTVTAWRWRQKESFPDALAVDGKAEVYPLGAVHEWVVMHTDLFMPEGGLDV